MKKDKAVSSTIEYILIFGVSFIILTTSVIVVQQMQERVVTSSNREKLETIGQKIASKVIETYSTHLEGEGYFKKYLNIPSQVNGKSYKVILGDDAVTVKTNDITVSVKLFNLNESVSLNGEESASEELFIYYDGQNISLRS